MTIPSFCFWIVSILIGVNVNASFAWTPSTNSAKHISFSSCRELVADYTAGHDFQQQSALQQTVLFVPPECCSPDLTYRQVATQSTCQGVDKLRQVSRDWWKEQDVEATSDDVDAEEWRLQSTMVQISSVSPTTVQIAWNVTFVPPTAWIWHRLGTTIPGLRIVYATYNHRSGIISTFSWKNVADALLDAIRTGQWRVPLACIQGLSRLEFQRDTEENENSDNDQGAPSRWKLCSITEDLVYAIDLQQGRLLNRKCAEDLRLFLEMGRRLPVKVSPNREQQHVVDQERAWLDVVATCLPWSSVPGSGSLDIEPMEEGEGPTSAVLFVASSVLVIVGFATVVAPELLGQSLF